MKVYRPSRYNKQEADTVWDSRHRTAAGSLFDRLVLDDEDISPTLSVMGVDGIVRSIKRNLDRALNVHAGTASSNIELGIPDFNYSTVGSLEVSSHLVEAIRRCIEIAEPRIRNIAVKCISAPETPLNLHFSITCDLTVGNSAEAIRIEMAMKDGHFHYL